MKNSIYDYFYDKETNRYLDKKVVDYVLEHLKENKLKVLEQSLGKNYKEKIIKSCSKKIKCHGSVIINRLKHKLNNLTSENIYLLETEEVISLYEKKYWYENTIYKYFKDKKTGLCLAKEVVDFLIDSLSDWDKETLILGYGPNYKTKLVKDISDPYYDSSKVILSKLRKKVELLSEENIYELPAQEVIRLYQEKYWYENTIYKFFKEEFTKKVIDKHIIDFMLDNASNHKKENLKLAFGNNYKRHLEINNDPIIMQNGRMAIHLIKKDFLSEIENNIYDMNFKEFLQEYKLMRKGKSMNVEAILENNNYLNYYLYFIQDEELFIKISEDYSFDLAIMLYLMTGKFLNRKFSISELSLFFKLDIEELYISIRLLNSMLNKPIYKIRKRSFK